jgi:putative acetyltransferase
MIIRDESSSDLHAIRHVVESAFGRSAEADLVDRLRADGDAVISLVAVDAERLIGHVLFSKMTAPLPSLGLAPVSVAPAHQRSGVGGQLIRAGIARAAEDGWACVFVLGDTAYYTRFGFAVELAKGFESPYAGPHFMALALTPDLAIRTGAIQYAHAFSSLD